MYFACITRLEASKADFTKELDQQEMTTAEIKRRKVWDGRRATSIPALLPTLSGTDTTAFLLRLLLHLNRTRVDYVISRCILKFSSAMWLDLT
jgi:hypothetical protein